MEQEIIKIEQKICHGTSEDKLILDQKRETVILCIDPDSDSDIVIEEGEEDFRERCIVIKAEQKKC